MTPTTLDDDQLIDNAHQEEWTPSSWRKYPAKQQPIYKEPQKHAKALEKLSTLPPLVTPSEVLPPHAYSLTAQVRRLREELKKVALNQKFLLHGGDCAEAFAYSAKVFTDRT
jgi:3-deoxy-7-phosphoheptulonate synthase